MQISYGKYTATITAMGAELKSLKKDGVEYIWTGDPAVWTGSAPWLFPVVGRLKDDCYTVDGKVYSMNAHGFASTSLFAAQKLAENHVRFTLRADEYTVACYPWSFVLTIDYTLVEDGLTMSACVRNDDESTMLFSLGAHPGLLCVPGDTLVFNTCENMDVLRLDADHLLVMTPNEWIKDGRLTLTSSLFDDDAMIVPHPAATSATLIRRNGMHVRVDFGKVNYLGLWSMKDGGLPYVCVEPWFGVDDLAESDKQLAHKEAINQLAPGMTFTQTVHIEAV